MTRDQDRLRQSTSAYKTLGWVGPTIADRLEVAHAAAAPQAPRRPGAPPAATDGPADPVHAQVAHLEEHLRSRGGPLHRIGLLLSNLDDLAVAIDADHTLCGGCDRHPRGFLAQVVTIRPSVRRGPVGARLHTIGALAGQIGQQLTLLNEAIYDTWRQMWRDGDDRYSNELDRALLTYSSAATYGASIAGALEPYATPQPLAICSCGPLCCPGGCDDRIWERGRRLSRRCRGRQERMRALARAMAIGGDTA